MSEQTPLSVSERGEIWNIANDLERFGLRRTADRLRALLGDSPDDERPCPIQDSSKRHRGSSLQAIPWGLAEVLYPAYGHDQSLERLAERGGFGRGELGMLAADVYSPTGRLAPDQMPLLTLYEMAKRGGQR